MGPRKLRRELNKNIRGITVNHIFERSTSNKSRNKFGRDVCLTLGSALKHALEAIGSSLQIPSRYIRIE